MPAKKSDESFWKEVESLVKESEIVIDRPKGSHHPRYPELVYPVNYGYLKNTTSRLQANVPSLRRRIYIGRVIQMSAKSRM